MATANLYWIKSKSSGSIVIQITHKKNKCRIYTGINIETKYWDKNTKKIKCAIDKIGNKTRVNQFLQTKLFDVQSKIQELTDQNKLEYLSVNEIKDYCLNHKNSMKFMDYFEQIINDLMIKKKPGNASVYVATFNSLKLFKGNNINFQEIDYKFLKAYERFLILRDAKINTISVYMRTLRSVINKAINDDLIKIEDYPFRKFKIKTEKTEKRALSIDNLRAFAHVKLMPGTLIYLAQQLFLFSFYARGMNFIDIAFLPKQKTDILIYKRKKTPTQNYIRIKINDKMQEILNQFSDSHTFYAFPVLKKNYQDADRMMRYYRNRRKRINEYLKVIAEIAEIKNHEKISFYAARHTWATLAKLKRIPLDVISEGLGHNNLSTTQIYLDDLPDRIVDDYNEQIINLD